MVTATGRYFLREQINYKASKIVHVPEFAKQTVQHVEYGPKGMQYRQCIHNSISQTMSNEFNSELSSTAGRPVHSSILLE